jgi:hypothetical protein
MIKSNSKHVFLIQTNDGILFEDCGEVTIYSQGSTGWLTERGKKTMDGATWKAESPGAIKLVLANGAEVWIKTVNSLNHVTIAPDGGHYELELPQGIHIVHAWSPDHGELTQVITVMRGQRVDWKFKGRKNI